MMQRGERLGLAPGNAATSGAGLSWHHERESCLQARLNWRLSRESFLSVTRWKMILRLSCSCFGFFFCQKEEWLENRGRVNLVPD